MQSRPLPRRSRRLRRRSKGEREVWAQSAPCCCVTRVVAPASGAQNSVSHAQGNRSSGVLQHHQRCAQVPGHLARRSWRPCLRCHTWGTSPARCKCAQRLVFSVTIPVARRVQEDFSTGVVSARRLANGVPAGLLIVLNQTRQAFAKYARGVGRWLLPRVCATDDRASQCSSGCHRTLAQLDVQRRGGRCAHTQIRQCAGSQGVRT